MRDLSEKDVTETIRDRTDGRGADSTIDAVGMESCGKPAATIAQQAAGLLPYAISSRMI